MNYVTLVMAAFAVLGALDCILGNRLGLGKEFERGLSMFGTLALSMIGMIVLAPVLAVIGVGIFLILIDLFLRKIRSIIRRRREARAAAAQTA